MASRSREKLRPVAYAAATVPPILLAADLSDSLSWFGLLGLLGISWLVTTVAVAVLFARRDERRRLQRLEEHLGAVWGLGGLVGQPNQLLPALGSWAISPRAGYQLLEIAADERPRTIVELGPGASTVLLDLLRRSLDWSPEIYCVEADEAHLERLRSRFERLGVEDVHLITAPVSPQLIGGARRSWYSEQALAVLPPGIDLLLVDGPSTAGSPAIRSAAYPALRDRLSDGAVIVVDDTDRSAERTMVTQWLEDPALALMIDAHTHVALRFTRSPR